MTQIRTTAAPRAVATTPRPRRWRRLGGRSIGLALPVALVVVWQLLKSVGALPYTNIPSPIDILVQTGQLIGTGELEQNVGHTLLACLGGWALGSAIGLVLGVVLGQFRPAWMYSMASIDVLRAIPAIAFVPIAVIIFAQTLQMEIIIAAWVSIWPVAVSTIDGVAGVSEMHHELATSLRLTLWQRIVKFALPTAMPKILVSLRLSLSGALVLAIVAEIVGNPAGIGYALVTEQLTLRPAGMFAYIGITGLLGLVLNALLLFVFRRFVPSSRRAEQGE